MDKTGIIVVSLCVALLVFWFWEQNKYAQQAALYQQTNRLAHAQSLLSATNSSAGTNTVNATMSSAPATATAPAVVPVFNTNAPEQLIVLTNGDARYTFTSRGGGLQQIELLKYPQTISARWKTKTGSQTNGVAALNMLTSVPSLALLGDPSLVDDGNYTLTKTDNSVRAEKVLASGLTVVKDFHPTSNYLVNATVRIENTTGKPINVPRQEYVVGTATPMDVDDRNYFNYGGAMWFDGVNAQVCNPTYFNTNTTVMGLFSRTPHSDYQAGNTNVMWAAVYNQFFALAAMPQKPADEVVAQPVTLAPFPNVEMTPGAAMPPGVQAALVYPAQTLTANSSVERQIVLFAGPKEYRTLAHVAADLQNRADLVMNWGSGYYSFWGIGTFFAKMLLSGMNALHDLTNVGYGWAIVIITVMLRGIFWPLMAASTRSMKRMQALSPELQKLKEKYKDDQQKFVQKQMELWKEHNVSPMSGCWPMLLQMPVFMGFFTMIRSAIELRGAHFLWVTDLSKPDTVFMIPGLDLPFNLLPLLMGGAMMWQSHLTPPSPGMDPSQQKMMRYMPLIFLVFLYNYSGGLALYMTISTTLSVLQTKLTKNLKDPAAKTPAGPAVNPALTPASKSKK